jgi:DNA processing protein
VCGDRRPRVDRFMESFDADRARRDAERAGLETVCPHRGPYPSALRVQRDAPAALYLKGDTAWLELLESERPVAVVGSRRASQYGKDVAYMLGRELAATGVPVVSGLAFGVDAAAHKGALAGHGPAVAVMPSGADVAYPRSHHELHRRLCEQGLVISEMPPGATPLKWCFPARNRIMAGLAHMTVVVEGTATSGSLISAQFAHDFGREVGAVPGQITSGLAAGPNSLLADGACLVRSTSDVLDALYGVGERPVQQLAPRQALEPRLEQLLEAVEAGRGVDSIVRAGAADVGDVLAGLTELELRGLVRRGAGGAYVRTTGGGAAYA